MGYIETVLDRDERVLQRGHLHWVIYAPVVVLLVLGIVCFFAGSDAGGVIGMLLVFTALIFWLSAWIARATTEIAVTSRRVIVKRGLIRRSTIEMNAGQIESVQVNQSIAGRLLDFGTVTVREPGLV